MMRFFNTTGPCDPRRHYMLGPEQRIPDLLPFVEQELYFVVHSARQTGKSTAMLAFAERLRGLGYAAIHATLEESQGIEDIERAEPIWLYALERGAQALRDELRPGPSEAILREAPGTRLARFLAAWCAAIAPVRLVLLLDEADVVSGPAMVSLLRQLRAGFVSRSIGDSPASIGLIGMRDLRDYLSYAKDGSPLNPGSPFNIKSRSLTLRNFTAAEVAELYGQHTAATGQPFTAEASARAFWWTQGQPFLVNALARISVMELAADPTQTITEAHIDEAKERLIRARTTHLDSLAERLKEERVARIVQPVLLGDTPFAVPYEHDDFQYVLDLGLLQHGAAGAEAANPMYREVLVRQLTLRMQKAISAPTWRWRTAAGRLDFPALVDAFLDWWRENADAITAHGNKQYPEALPHLAFMAFLQRVVNGGGTVLREYAAGRGAVDVVVTYGPDRFVVELKRVFRGGKGFDKVKQQGIAQLSDYLDTLDEPEGWLIIFDQRASTSWEQRLWRDEQTVGGRCLYLRGA